jgi:hypothetical protein
MTKTRFNRVLAFILAVVSLLSAFTMSANAAQITSKTPASAYAAVKKAYGSSFPLTSKNRIKGKKRIMGVKISDCSSYYAASKTTGGSNSQKEYAIFICKAKSTAKAKKIKTSLANYLKNEEQSMSNYLSATGKKLFKNAKTGRIGKYVYLVMIDTNKNTKAVNAIKKTLK